jgi:hypothetical protein
VSLELVVSVMGDNGHILCCSRNDGSLVQYPGVVPAEQRRYSLYCPAIHGVFFGGRYWDADFEEGTSNMSQKQKKKVPCIWQSEQRDFGFVLFTAAVTAVQKSSSQESNVPTASNTLD